MPPAYYVKSRGDRRCASSGCRYRARKRSLYCSVECRMRSNGWWGLPDPILQPDRYFEDSYKPKCPYEGRLYLGRCDGAQEFTTFTVVKLGMSSDIYYRFDQFNRPLRDHEAPIKYPESVVTHFRDLQPIVHWWSKPIVHGQLAFVEAVAHRALAQYCLDESEFFVWGEHQAVILKRILQVCEDNPTEWGLSALKERRLKEFCVRKATYSPLYAQNT